MTRLRAGRRPGESGSRDAILAAARSRFAAHGYDRTTIRAVASDARVDPALVMHFFGSKEQLFVAAIELTINPAEAIPALLAEGREGLGARFARFYLGLWENPETRDGVAALMRSAMSHDDAAAIVRRFLGREVIGRLATGLTGKDAELRAELAGAHLVGVGIARYIVKVEPLASADVDELARTVGATIQRYLG